MEGEVTEGGMKAQMEVTLQNGLLGSSPRVMPGNDAWNFPRRCKEAEAHFLPALRGQLGVD